jgi:hypothetical protein
LQAEEGTIVELGSQAKEGTIVELGSQVLALYKLFPAE